MQLAQKWHTPHIADIEEEIRWELNGVERGALRVREAMDEQKVGESEVGQKLIGRIAPRLIAAIKAAKKEAIKGLADAGRGKGQPPTWWWLIVHFKPEQLAVIVLKTVFAEKPRDFTFAQPVTTLATKIARYAQLQLDFETWKQEEDDEFRQYLRTTKQLDERSFKKFSEKIGRKRLEKWDLKLSVIFGAKMIDLLAETVPEWFSVESSRLKGGRTETQLVLSDAAKETLGDLAERSELSRPMLLPMIVPPADWRPTA